MTKIRLRLRGDRLVALYDDKQANDYQRLGLLFTRASHIDPSPDGSAFWIIWKDPDVIESIGEDVTKTDASGRPFLSKGAAEAYEVELLNSRYLKDVPCQSPTLLAPPSAPQS